MDYFQYKNGALYAEDVALTDIAAQYGSPTYVYSKATLTRHYQAFDQAMGDYPHEICYAVKANSHIAILNVLAHLGAGFDIVSGGELKRVIAAGGAPQKTVFSGVGKLDWEIEYAIENNIGCFNIESQGELEKIQHYGKLHDKVVNISVRLNPDVDAKTHPYISTGLKENKFGLTHDAAMQVYQLAKHCSHVHIHGIACHIGSQLTQLSPFVDALHTILDFVEELKSQQIDIEKIDFGGGLGVRYHDENPPQPSDYWQALLAVLQARNVNLPFAIEPGRALIGNAGILLTQINFIKSTEHAKFCIVDAAMNDLIRPALYAAYQEIIEVTPREDAQEQTYNIVGAVCESADFLGKQRQLRVQNGDLLAIRTAGAYCAAMMSNYNTRARAAEVMVDGDTVHEISPRQSIESIFAHEKCLNLSK